MEYTMKLNLTPELVAGFAAVLQCVGTDKLTPVLMAVRVTPEHLLATDRYIAARFTHGQELPEDAEPVTVPAATVKILAALKPALGATITLESDRYTIADSEGNTLSAATFENITTFNFPPVDRLFPDAPNRAGESTLGAAPEFLSLAPKTLVKALNASLKIDKNAPASFEFTKTNNPLKPGPVLMTQGALAVLIQPSMLLR